MRPSFMILMTLGLALMGYYWWVGWEAEEASLAIATKSGPIRGCAIPEEGAEKAVCPEALPQCLSLEVLPSGVCTKGCETPKDCPEHWCCVAPPKQAQKMCAPPTVCVRSNIK
jgi:hypothetical protein